MLQKSLRPKIPPTRKVLCRGIYISKVQPTNATFSRSIYFYKLLYMFQEVPPPIIKSTKLYIERQVLSNLYCYCSIGFRWFLFTSSGAQKCTYSVRYCQTYTATTVSVSGGSSAHHQEHKGVHTASGIVKHTLLLQYRFQAVPPPIIRSTKVYIQRQVLSNIHCYYSIGFRRFLRPSSGAQRCTHSVRYCQTYTATTVSVSGGSSAHHQEHKGVHTASGIVKHTLLLQYQFQAVPPPIIRSTKVYIQRQVLSNLYCYCSIGFRRFLRPS